MTSCRGRKANKDYTKVVLTKNNKDKIFQTYSDITRKGYTINMEFLK